MEDGPRLLHPGVDRQGSPQDGDLAIANGQGALVARKAGGSQTCPYDGTDAEGGGTDLVDWLLLGWR